MNDVTLTYCVLCCHYYRRLDTEPSPYALPAICLPARMPVLTLFPNQRFNATRYIYYCCFCSHLPDYLLPCYSVTRLGRLAA